VLQSRVGRDLPVLTLLSRDDVGETLLSYLLYKKGLVLKNVMIVSKRPQDVAQAFLNDETDACVTWEPWLTAVLKKPGAQKSHRSYTLGKTL
jgi:ABC-type nitrate/sulfonate/bicarbonate transport system substrate-binding protein